MLLSIWCDGMVFGIEGCFSPHVSPCGSLIQPSLWSTGCGKVCMLSGRWIHVFFITHIFKLHQKKSFSTWISFDVHHPISPTITARLVLYHRIDAEAIPDLRMSNKKDLKNKFQCNLYESYHLKNQVY